MLLRKEVSWILLTFLFIFDNIVSYYGVKYLNGREGNLLIAPLVERYPLLYFICIPLTIFIMIIVVRILKLIAIKLLKKWKINEILVEQIILGAIVIYWAIANSSLNLIFFLGYRLPINISWPISTIVGLLLSFIYAFLLLNSINRI